jgi:DNA repair exonuclease SbcCD nuclease subunit
MKIALITDLHFGTHSDSKEHLKYQQKFFDEVFFPYLKKHNIRTVIDLGDTFDKRKNISFYTLKKSKEFYFDKLVKNKIECYIIVGNHTLHFKESNDINSPELLLANQKNFHVVSEPLEVMFDGVKFLLMPWINKENQEECYKIIDQTDSDYLIGHFEIVGMKLHNSWEFSKGVDRNILNKFKEVWSGHYHLKMNNGNFTYLGTQYQLDWGDYGLEKGFYIFDTETKNLSFIENSFKIYQKIQYSEEINRDTFNFGQYKDSYVKIILNKQIDDFAKFDLFKEKLGEFVYKIDVDEKYLQKIEASMDKGIEYEDTLSIMKKYIEGQENIDIAGMIDIMEEIYNEARQECD